MLEFHEHRSVTEFEQLDTITEEYLDIYLFHLLVEEENANAPVDIEGYNNFHIKSSTLTAYTEFHNQNKDNNSNVIDQYLSSHPEVFELFKTELYRQWYPKPIIWNERNHNDYYIKKLEASFTFELYVYRSFYERGVDLQPYWDRDGQNAGENNLGVEIKFDMESANTQNYYIEYAEKTHPANLEYVASGILKNDNTLLWFIGTIDEHIIIRKSTLVQMYNRQRAIRQRTGQTEAGYRFTGIATSLGLLVRKDIARRAALTLDEAANLLLDQHD